MAKKPRRKPAPPLKRRRAAATLTPAERNRILRAPGNYEELARKTAAKLAQVGRRVRAAVSAPRLAALVKRAEAAQAREEKLRSALEARLRPLSDARLVADGSAWRAVLDVWAAVQTAARNDPALYDEFQFLRTALAKPRPPSTPTPTPSTP